jgi:tRNA nucleotidyltransferase (CCA-adding enzyme)
MTEPSPKPAAAALRTYLVGGAVRDALMGRAVKDRDWCVVGSTPEEMVQRGFLPVGKDFPVFLHPETREEYALARTERKTAAGYHGFQFHTAADVTIEQDLARRDITINSIAYYLINTPASRVFDAKSLKNQDLIDPFDGQRDIEQKILRHTSPAFAEDPVRILRIARFAARYPGFSVAQETMGLMRRMVAAGEVDALVPERVWQELAKGLMEEKPSRMFQVLRQCGALEILLPDVQRLWGVPQPEAHHPEIDTGVHLMMVLDMAAQLQAPLAVRFACLTHDLGKGTTAADVLPRHIGHEKRSVGLLLPLCERLRVPVECKELAVVVAQEHGNIHRSGDLSAEATLRLLERCDALRRPERFAQVLLACECDARGRLAKQGEPYPQATRLQRALAVAQAVPTAALAEQAQLQGRTGQAVGELIAKARRQAIHQAFADLA